MMTRNPFTTLPRALVARRWLLLVPLAVGIAAAGPLGSLVPARYRSEALVAAPAGGTDPVGLVKEQILSRPRLESIVKDLNLYPSERGGRSMDEVVARMRNDIEIRPGGSPAAVRVSYIAPDASTARKATERLTSSSAASGAPPAAAQADASSLDAEIAKARERVAEQEKKLADFKERQTTPSRAALQNAERAQRELQETTAALASLRAHRSSIERQLADARARAAAAPAPQPDQPPVLSTAAQQLGMAKAQLELYKLRLPPDHPDVVALQRTIAQIEARVAQESASAAARTAVPPDDKRIRDLQAELAGADREIAATAAEERRLRRALSVPPAASTGDAELLAITREYATLQRAYSDLLVKREPEARAPAPGRDAVAQDFRVLEPASLPAEPINGSRRLTIMSAAPLAGLAVGLLLVVLAEARDRSFKRGVDVTRALGLPVLAIVPVMASDAERRAARRRTLTADAGGFAVLLASIAILVLWRAQG